MSTATDPDYLFFVSTVTGSYHKTFVNLTVFSRDQQVCASYSLKVGHPGCAIILLPCTSDGPGNSISVYYMAIPSQSTMSCFSATPGCYSTAVFAVNKDGKLDILPAKTDVVTVRVIGKKLTIFLNLTIDCLQV